MKFEIKLRLSCGVLFKLVHMNNRLNSTYKETNEKRQIKKKYFKFKFLFSLIKKKIVVMVVEQNQI